MKEKEQESCEDDDDDDGMTKKLIREQGKTEKEQHQQKRLHLIREWFLWTMELSAKLLSH